MLKDWPSMLATMAVALFMFLGRESRSLREYSSSSGQRYLSYSSSMLRRSTGDSEEDLDTSWLGGSLNDDEDKPVIVLAVSCQTVHMMDDIVEGMRRDAIDQDAVVAMVPLDAHVHQVLEEMYSRDPELKFGVVTQIPPFISDNGADTQISGSTWLPRVLRSFLQRDFTVMHIDANTTWKTSPLKFLDQAAHGLETADHQTTYQFSDSDSNQFGLVASFNPAANEADHKYLYLQPTFPTKHFLKEWDDYVQAAGDNSEAVGFRHIYQKVVQRSVEIETLLSGNRTEALEKTLAFLKVHKHKQLRSRVVKGLQNYLAAGGPERQPSERLSKFMDRCEAAANKTADATPAHMDPTDDGPEPKFEVKHINVFEGDHTTTDMETRPEPEDFESFDDEEDPENEIADEYIPPENEKKPMIDGAMLHKVWTSLSRTTSGKPLQRHVLPNVVTRTCDTKHGANAITALTHLGISKLNRLRVQASLWDGPVIAALYMSRSTDIDRLLLFWENNAKKGGMCHITVHIVMEFMVPDLPENIDMSLEKYGYPHNIMRNVAMKYCDSNYYATFDADFMTFPGAHETLQTLFDAKNEELRNKMKQNRTLLVLPAFDTLDDNPSSLPQDRSAALKATTIRDFSKTGGQKFLEENDKASIFPFHLGAALYGHNATNFPKWYQLDESNPNDAWYDIEYTREFEPYVIGFIDRQSMADYDEDFRGYGLNKQSWVLDMHCRGYRFAVLRDMVMIHLFHDMHTREFKDFFRPKSKDTYDEFSERLLQKYPKCNMGYRTAKVSKPLYDNWYALTSVPQTDVPTTSLPPIRRTIVPNLWNRTCESKFEDDAITATTHLEVSKLDRMLLQAKLWNGPVSAAIYVTGPQDIDRLVSFWKQQNTTTTKPGSNATHSDLCHITVHVVMEYLEPRVVENKQKTLANFGYPHNIMRNVALENIDSDFYATFDADFMPLSNAHAILQTTIGANEGRLRNKMLFDKTLLVMPAFETLDENPDSLPSTRTEALDATIKEFTKKGAERFAEAADKKAIYPFHLGVAPGGHGATDFSRWVQLNDMDANDACFDIEFNRAFEPYVIGLLDREMMPKFPEQFRGFGYNKASWVLNMHCLGYRFATLRDMIVMHLYHESNHDAGKKSHKSHFLPISKEQFLDFTSKLQKEHPTCKMHEDDPKPVLA